MSDNSDGSDRSRRGFVKLAGVTGATLAGAGTASAGSGKKPKYTIEFHSNCRRATVNCDEKVTIKAYTKKEHKWGGKAIEKQTKNFDWTVGKHNYFTKIEVHYKGELIEKKNCKRKSHRGRDDHDDRKKRRRRRKRHRRRREKRRRRRREKRRRKGRRKKEHQN